MEFKLLEYFSFLYSFISLACVVCVSMVLLYVFVIPSNTDVGYT